MIASVEKPDGTYVHLEVGDPVCGKDFDDHCGCCLACYDGDCGQATGGWVIYLEDERNPWHGQRRAL